MSAPRYALYLAPRPDHPLWRFGSEAIGYDAASGGDLPIPPVEGLAPERLRALTEDPRTYGFHATLKPPFRLTEGETEATLLRAVEAFAAGRRGFDIADLAVTAIGSFLALTVPGRPADLYGLADACVTDFDRFRAPMTDAERAKRLTPGLDAAQIAHVERWGYPHVFEAFRFHMTLSGRVPEAERAILAAALATRFEGVRGPLQVDDLTVFAQPGPGERFRILARFRFGG